MTGGLIQLVAYGLQDLFLTRDPQITFFKVVYRRHTNFSMEQVPQFFRSELNFDNRASCVLSTEGDLIGQVYIVIELPRIKQFYIDSETIDPNTKFAWIRKIGHAMIKTIDIEISGQLVDRHYGEWLNIWSELLGSKDQDRGLDIMIGNVPELTNFTNGKDPYTLYIPLQFWFCRNSGLALPLVSLQYSEVKISVELNAADQCYIITPTDYIDVYNDIVNFQPFEYIEQNVNGQIASGIFTSFDFLTRRLYYKKISRNNFQSIQNNAVSVSEILNIIYPSNNSTISFKYFIVGQTTGVVAMPRFNSVSHPVSPPPSLSPVNITNAFLLVEYIYLDQDERIRFVQTKHDYLIETINYSGQQTIESTGRVITIDLVQPCKFMVWIVQQEYLLDTNNNDFFNYTDSYVYIENQQIGKSLVKSETIKLNSQNRLTKRSYIYFNWIQPYQCFPHTVDEGINVYSFSIFPDKYQPSGSCNMSQIDFIQLDLTLQNIITNKNTVVVRTYGLEYNVLRVVNGVAGLVFTK